MVEFTANDCLVLVHQLLDSGVARVVSKDGRVPAEVNVFTQAGLRGLRILMLRQIPNIGRIGDGKQHFVAAYSLLHFGPGLFSRDSGSLEIGALHHLADVCPIGRIGFKHTPQ